MKIESWTAHDVLNGYKEKKLSPVEFMSATISRIERFDPIINAFVLFDGDSAIEQSQESEKRWNKGAPCGPLDGIPITIKDAIAVRGWATRQGSCATSTLPEKADAPVVELLRKSGAIIVGKTTLPEFGFKSTTDSILSGVTRNPWNLKMTPGGSSGGACAAAALGMGLLHVGTDGGGSIRQPASYCGVAGFKPSAGRIPNLPIPLYRTILCTGPIAKSVKDCALMFSTMAKLDRRDPFCLPNMIDDISAVWDSQNIKGVKIAYFPNMGTDCSPEVYQKMDSALQVFSDLGAEITHLEWKWKSLKNVMSTIVECHKYYNVKSIDKGRVKFLDHDYIRMAERAESRTAMDYMVALHEMDKFGSNMSTFMDDFDMIITPSVPILPFDVSDKKPEGLDAIDWYELESFNYPFSLSGQPAISIPIGLSESGLPIGMQLVGAKFADIKVLEVASAFQTICPPCLPDL